MIWTNWLQVFRRRDGCGQDPKSLVGRSACLLLLLIVVSLIFYSKEATAFRAGLPLSSSSSSSSRTTTAFATATKQSFFSFSSSSSFARRSTFSTSTKCQRSKTASKTTTALSMALTLYGHPGTRSPLVNWACHELGVDFVMASDLSQNPHPFGQLPCLTDNNGDNDDNVVLFESGAILQYLLRYYAKDLSKAQQAAVMSWITWANASLDPICFLETPEGKVYDTGLKRPNRRIDRLNVILSQRQFLVPAADPKDANSSVFTLADVAVASYLLYALQFFPDLNLQSQWPAVVRYMNDCASRPAYGQAFGPRVQSYLLEALSKQQDKSDKSKKLFGMF